MSPLRAVVAECTGTALLLATVVGSGIMGERLSTGNPALALLGNSVATGAVLIALIFTFAPISGAHFNPLVTLAAAVGGGTRWKLVPAYVGAQFVGAAVGVLAAHLMFGMPLVMRSLHARSGRGQFVSEAIATFGLLVVVHGTGGRPSVVPLSVGTYITAAYWFTASTSFANPAVTLMRAFTDTFSGIRLLDVPLFIGAQIVGAASATLLFRWLLPPSDERGLT